ncbi:nonA-l [Drosophila busckii]|uniref:NonA-l n=1 Tax=Drosophila busckii TaxID=30019 RepID=A0A0M5IWX2_DROBS|nr:protein no-on-transient A [Drosophila busckii]ALC40144.1 nonA-l [Drosophila busckii]
MENEIISVDDDKIVSTTDKRGPIIMSNEMITPPAKRFRGPRNQQEFVKTPNGNEHYFNGGGGGGGNSAGHTPYAGKSYRGRVAGNFAHGNSVDQGQRGGWQRGSSNGGGGRSGGGSQQRSDDYMIIQKLRQLGGPTLDLEEESSADLEEQKFSNHNRLYLGNLSGDLLKETGLRELFKPYGEVEDVFLNSEKGFAFLKVDLRCNAEKAKRVLDASTHNGRQLRVRFAPSGNALRVSNISHFVSNELLYKSFEIFGPIERAVISVDDRGNHMGEGTVEFLKRSSALLCLRWCNDKCYFLTASLRPCVVEIKEDFKDPDGLPEKALAKSREYVQERNVGPHFADVGTFEHEYGNRWKDLHVFYNSRMATLKQEMQLEEKQLDAQMEFARYERETQLLREELLKREADNERMKLEWEMREKQKEEQRMLQEEQQMLRRQHSVPQLQQQQQQQRDAMFFRRRNSFVPGPSPQQQQQPQSFNMARNAIGLGDSGIDVGSPFVVFEDSEANAPIADNPPVQRNFNNQDSIDVVHFEDGNGQPENPALWGRRTL